MFPIILSVLAGLILSCILFFTDVSGTTWSILFGLLLAVASYAAAALFLRRTMGAEMKKIQGIMETGQRQVQSRVQAIQSRPVGNPTQIMQELEKMQHKLLQQCLDASGGLDRFINWVPLMTRQIATMRLQFNYQMKNFDAVDRYLPKALFLDPLTMAMKLAQLYRRKTPTAIIRTEFNKLIKRTKYNQGTLPYSLMAWIYIQENDSDAAHAILVDAAKNTENETIKRNRDRLANNKPREFSNLGLGDEWYALLLEAPKIQTRRQQPSSYGRPF